MYLLHKHSVSVQARWWMDEDLGLFKMKDKRREVLFTNIKSLDGSLTQLNFKCPLNIVSAEAMSLKRTGFWFGLEATYS